MKELKDLLTEQQDLFEGHKYITTEFQDYGYRLALKLGDLKHKSLYIRLAKEEPRALLEQALSFAIDYPEARNKARIFMWKLKELRGERDNKKGEKQDEKQDDERDEKKDDKKDDKKGEVKDKNTDEKDKKRD